VSPGRRKKMERRGTSVEWEKRGRLKVKRPSERGGKTVGKKWEEKGGVVAQGRKKRKKERGEWVDRVTGRGNGQREKRKEWIRFGFSVTEFVRSFAS
jgi:hypothetical protein